MLSPNKIAVLVVAAAMLLQPPTYCAETKVTTKDPVLNAMRDELERSIRSLRVEKKHAPYFITYRVTDDKHIRLSYELGTKAEEDRKHERSGIVDMHVGNHTFDNEAELTDRSTNNQSRHISLDDSYDAIRRSFWVMSDEAYKDASEDLEKQEAYKRGHIIRNLCESFSSAKPEVAIDLSTPELKLNENWDERLRKLSLVFGNYPEIRKSWVVFEADHQIFRLANTEGTTLRYPWTPIVIAMTAFARCPDGEDIWDCDYVRVSDEKDLPTQTELEDRAKRLSENVVAYTKAERKNYYFGPVLFEQQAAGELLQHGIAPKLCAIPGDNLHPSGRLLRCVNTRILPKFLSINDDPSITTFQNQPIAGPYAFDDEGVACSKVQIVDHGFLKELLSSRKPVLPNQKSNGHFFNDHVAPSTLIMQSEKPIPLIALEKQLLRLAKEQGLKEAIIVKRIVPRTGNILHGELSTARADSLDSCQALEVYSVDVSTGKRTRVRGLDFRGFDLGAMQGIVAAGSDAKAYDSVNWNGSVRTIVAPSLLVNHLELEEDGSNTLGPYPLENPYFAAK